MTQINHAQQSGVTIPTPVGLRTAGGQKSITLTTEGDPQQLCSLIEQLIAALQTIRPQGPPA